MIAAFSLYDSLVLFGVGADCFEGILITLHLKTIRNSLQPNQLFLLQAFFLAIRKKTQGEKNSKLKEKTKTQAQNSNFRHFLKKLLSLKTCFYLF